MPQHGSSRREPQRRRMHRRYRGKREASPNLTRKQPSAARLHRQNPEPTSSKLARGNTASRSDRCSKPGLESRLRFRIRPRRSNMATATPKPASATMTERIAELRGKRAKIEEGGGAKRIQKQHEVESSPHASASTNWSTAKASRRSGYSPSIGPLCLAWLTRTFLLTASSPDARPLTAVWFHLASQDFTVAGGAAGEVHCAKIVEMMKLSLKTGSPFIFVNDSGGRACRKASTAWRLCECVLQQCHAFWDCAANFHHLRTVCRGRSLQSGADRLHHSDQAGADIHHRSASHQTSNRRDRKPLMHWAVRRPR